ncbi:hypothetical protein AKJ16_DCAP15272 [Drosera capensis]
MAENPSARLTHQSRPTMEEAPTQPKTKPPFRIVKDDTKPLLQDPLWTSDPIHTEEAVLRLPPLPWAKSMPEKKQW